MFEDSFEYTKNAVWGKWIKWLLLIVFCIIFPLILGYMMEIMRRREPAPELENLEKFFVDGIKLFLVMIIYAIPLIILILLIIGGSLIFHINPILFLSSMSFGFLLIFFVTIGIGIFATTAFVKMARTGNIQEAFNFSAIWGRINKIGVLNYIVAIFLLFVTLSVIYIIISLIPAIGSLLNFIFAPLYGIFMARYITLLYDSPLHDNF